MTNTRRLSAAVTCAVTLATFAGCRAADSSAAAAAVTQAAPARNEILWDKYGVPHVYGTRRGGGVLRLRLRAGAESR